MQTVECGEFNSLMNYVKQDGEVLCEFLKRLGYDAQRLPISETQVRCPFCGEVARIPDSSQRWLCNPLCTTQQHGIHGFLSRVLLLTHNEDELLSVLEQYERR